MPLSNRSGMYSTHAPQVWYQIFAWVRERMYCTNCLCRGFTTRR